MSHQRGMTLRRATHAASLQGYWGPQKNINRTVLSRNGLAGQVFGRHWSLVIGSLVIGHWSLVIGYGALVIGYGALGMGHWGMGHWVWGIGYGLVGAVATIN